MQQRLSIITLGVKDLKKSTAFYEKLGWKKSEKSQDSISFFQLGGIAFSLFPWEHLAKDANQKQAESSGFRGVTIAHNVESKSEVARVLHEAEAAGAKIIKPAQDVFWGGHSGYFADLDGHLWEVAWNPFAEITADGSFQL